MPVVHTHLSARPRARPVPATLVALAVLTTIAACRPAPTPPVTPGSAACQPAALEAAFRRAMTAATDDTGGKTRWLLAVRAPELGLDVRVASPGVDPDAPFRVASTTKTFTAAAILRLVEDGQLGLDDTLDAVAPAPLVAIVRGGGYDPGRITLRQLLQHTSGLWDYAASDAYQAEVRRAPRRRWTREDQLRFAIAHGHPAGAPGATFAYADTGYILLGAVLEARTGQPLAAALRQLLALDALGLTSTWLESLEPAPAAAHAFAPQRFAGVALQALDPSADLWGGGGLAATTHDLVTFFDALFAGRVLHRPETLATMEDVPRTNHALKAGMGTFRLDPGPGVACFHHGGFWGTETVSCPAIHSTFSLTGTDAPDDEPPINDLFRRVMSRLTDCAGKPMSTQNRAPALPSE